MSHWHISVVSFLFGPGPGLHIAPCGCLRVFRDQHDTVYERVTRIETTNLTLANDVFRCSIVCTFGSNPRPIQFVLRWLLTFLFWCSACFVDQLVSPSDCRLPEIRNALWRMLWLFLVLENLFVAEKTKCSGIGIEYRVHVCRCDSFIFQLIVVDVIVLLLVLDCFVLILSNEMWQKRMRERTKKRLSIFADPFSIQLRHSDFLSIHCVRWVVGSVTLFSSSHSNTLHLNALERL